LRERAGAVDDAAEADGVAAIEYERAVTVGGDYRRRRCRWCRHLPMRSVPSERTVPPL